MGQVLAAFPQTFGYIGVERPAHTVERTAANGAYEVRAYPKLLAAEVDSDKDKLRFTRTDSLRSGSRNSSLTSVYHMMGHIC